jgi:hypothetical protein
VVTYARILKTIDQDADVERFQALHQAYGFARHSAKNNTAQPAAPIWEEDPLPEAKVPVTLDPVEELRSEPKPTVDPEPEKSTDDDFSFEPDWVKFNLLNKELSDLIAIRNYNADKWMDILGDPVLDFANTSVAAEQTIVEGLMELYRKNNLFNPIPHNNWFILIENRFSWIADGLRFERSFPGSLIIRDRFNACYPKPKNPLPVRKRVIPTGPPELPFYARWWFILAVYFVFNIAIQ